MPVDSKTQQKEKKSHLDRINLPLVLDYQANLLFLESPEN